MNKPIPQSIATPLIVASALLLVSACSSSDNTSTEQPCFRTPLVTDTQPAQAVDMMSPPASGMQTINYGYAFTRGPFYESGRIERISLTDGNIVDSTYPATSSDHKVATDGKDVYQIGRFNIDNLTKYSATDTSVMDYQISVLCGSPTTTNPQAIAFVDENLAYLTRRISDQVLIIDPTPDETTPESLVTGAIDLSAYNISSDETLDFPDMTDAVVVDDKLFVLLENLNNNDPINRGYLAVIDINTNMEIATQQGEFPRQGIELKTVNPTALHFNETTGLLYVAGRGNYFLSPNVPGDPYTGGIESIDPVSYQTTLIIDDGTQDANNGFITEAIVISDSLGYMITLDGFNDDFSSISNLRSFNPSTGEVSEPIEGTANQNLTTLALGLDDHLWVGIQSDSPGFIRVDLATGVPAAERVATSLIPSNIVFIAAER